MIVVLFSSASVAAVSVISLAGLLAVSIDPARLRRSATWLVSLAVGALLGDAFLHLLPSRGSNERNLGGRPDL